MPRNSGPALAAPGGSELRGSALSLRYGRAEVVTDVSIALRPGEVTALVGPNGSGKSTLLRSLARLHPVTSGEVTLSDGAAAGQPNPVSAFSAREFAREVTLFAQSRPAPEGLTVAEVVAFGRHPYRRRFAGLSEADRDAVAAGMAATGVAAMATRAVGELSGGEMQRVWLAACIAQETGVVLLDEPINHLDLRYQVETLDLVRDLAERERVAVGVVLHVLNHAAAVADRVVLLAGGSVLAAGTPAEVLTAAHIEAAYEVPVLVHHDGGAGTLRVEALGRYSRRSPHPPSKGSTS